jgi:hypothetical protein
MIARRSPAYCAVGALPLSFPFIRGVTATGLSSRTLRAGSLTNGVLVREL